MTKGELLEIEKRFNVVVRPDSKNWKEQVVREDFGLLVFLVRKLVVERKEVKSHVHS